MHRSVVSVFVAGLQGNHFLTVDYHGHSSGMKVLLLDPITTRIVSMVYSQTQILEKEVYLVELLGKEHIPMNHLKALVFVQPTEANYDIISKVCQIVFREEVVLRRRQHHFLHIWRNIWRTLQHHSVVLQSKQLVNHCLISPLSQQWGDWIIFAVDDEQ